MLSISNIAWDVSLDQDVSEILVHHGMSHIDIAPPKYFPSPSQATNDDILKVRNYWLEKGIEPLGMQSLLFGTKDLNVFGSIDIRDKLLAHLSDICHIGNILGAKKLVFGSPKNRDRAHLNDKETLETAVDFFNRLGDIAKSENVVVCLEPNPVCYQANFMTNSPETAEVVEAVNHEHIRMQLDIGAMHINQESANEIIERFAHLIGHIHISEPQLAPLNIKNLFHRQAAESIHHYLPEMPMTIEMLTTNRSMTLTEIEQSIHVIKEVYQDD
ncbi:Xylose isomerase domain protein TIM barrel [Psychromonas ingrahamii 37]|uniref:Xylose isomerase domain protein TIM barrel n=1 Tax=Psychromonas ingrahamii (strain DSM 17664 / CCUG 51855 / 37) TaxID=357804 RepID=A1SS45_PSYIN|nr:TIM barrel protein [Psychromonas ingrahamii]ABM02310.1 Xylose isomerase domain protein TIM barrel [Psychromonas ingrahamii 37]